MKGKALGIIETVGLVPAVEAGDVAVKTADVSIIGSQAVGGGLVSILMTGDVAAVRASLDAGSTAAARLGEVCSITVIARTADGLDGILIEEGRCPAWFPERTASVAPQKESEKQVEESPNTDAESPESVEGEPLSFDIAELKKLKVTKLRRLARQLPTFAISRGEIKYARKKDLLEAFTAYIKSLT